MKLRDRISNASSTVKSKLSADTRAAERGASSKVAELKKRARQDARTAGRRAKSVDRQDVKRALRKAGKGFEGVEGAAAGAGGDQEQETFARAEDNAMMGAPMDVGLNPTTSPEDVQGFVTGGGSRDPDTQPQGLGSGFGGVDDMVTGTGSQDGGVDEFGTFGQTSSDDNSNPLEFNSFGDGDGALDIGDERWF